MPKIWSPRHINNQQTIKPELALRSKRPAEYKANETKKIRVKVFWSMAFFVILYLIYFLLNADKFQVSRINAQIKDSQDSAMLEQSIKEYLSGRKMLVFKKSSYFLLNTDGILTWLNKQGLGLGVSVRKNFPDSLTITKEEKVSQLVWVRGEQFYLVGTDGKVIHRLERYGVATGTLPAVYDLSNAVIGEKAASPKLLSLIEETLNKLPAYDLPGAQLDYLKVDSPSANYLKIVTKKGFEIHVSYDKPLDTQLAKLKKSLLAGKIDLNKIQYINLRIENQVIYK